jgi:hypothetical protein
MARFSTDRRRHRGRCAVFASDWLLDARQDRELGPRLASLLARARAQSWLTRLFGVCRAPALYGTWLSAGRPTLTLAAVPERFCECL